MGRKPRIEKAGADYCISAKANRPFIENKDDIDLALQLMAEMCARFDVGIYAYAFLPTEYHFLLMTRRANLTLAMQWFGSNLTRRHNRARNGSGRLFTKRYQSRIISDKADLSGRIQHIHHMPVSTGLAIRFEDSRWTSLPAYSGHSPKPEWMEFPETDQIGPTPSIDISKRHGEPDLNNAVRLAAEKFGRPVPALLTRTKKPTPERLDRDLLIYVLYSLGRHPNREIARYFNLTDSSVSHIVRKIKDQVLENKALEEQADELRNFLVQAFIKSYSPKIEARTESTYQEIERHLDLAEDWNEGGREAESSLQAEKSRAMKKKLVMATLVCLDQYGYHGTTVSKVIERAGVSRGAWRHHFPNKKALVAEAAKAMYAGTIQRVIRFVPTIENVQNPMAALLEFIRQNFHQGWHRNVWLEFTTAARTDRELRELMTPLIGAFFKATDEAARRFIESLKPDVASAEMLVNLTLYVSRGMAIQSITHDDPDHFEILGNLWPRLLNGFIRLRQPGDD